MATLNIGSTLINANTERQTAGQTIPSRFSQARITLVDTNNQWGAAQDPTRHIKCWGLQISRDGGTTWQWWLFSGDSHDSPVLADGETQPRAADTNLWISFGFRDKVGGMPWLQVEASDFLEEAGSNVRLAVLTDAQVRLGAQIVAV